MKNYYEIFEMYLFLEDGDHKKINFAVLTREQTKNDYYEIFETYVEQNDYCKIFRMQKMMLGRVTIIKSLDIDIQIKQLYKVNISEEIVILKIFWI